MQDFKITVIPKALEAFESASINALLEEALSVDKALALDEAARLSLKNGSTKAVHFLLHDAKTSQLLGYANLLPDATLQAVVHPHVRRNGYGSALLEAVLKVEKDPGVWVHSNPFGHHFLRAQGFTKVRELYQMKLASFAEYEPNYELVKRFSDANQLAQLVKLNSLSFASHPEQGALGEADFLERFNEPWFRPEKLYIVPSGLTNQKSSQLAAFLWLKVEALKAEIYVAATHPDFQGKGLAKELLNTALAELKQEGFTEVTLFVDGANQAATRLYESFGFEIFESHAQYRRIN